MPDWGRQAPTPPVGKEKAGIPPWEAGAAPASRSLRLEREPSPLSRHFPVWESSEHGRLDGRRALGTSEGAGGLTWVGTAQSGRTPSSHLPLLPPPGVRVLLRLARHPQPRLPPVPVGTYKPGGHGHDLLRIRMSISPHTTRLFSRRKLSISMVFILGRPIFSALRGAVKIPLLLRNCS